MNSDKNTWFCGGCQRGGDIYDLAAIGLGFDIENYKNSQFVELRRAIASHFVTYFNADTGAIIQETTDGTPYKVNDGSLMGIVYRHVCGSM
jgi:hypothetical protein